MTYALTAPSTSQRSGLLGIVIGAHVVAGLAILATRTVMPQISEQPLVVELLQPATQEAPATKPQPVMKPTPVRQPIPKSPAPVIEATKSDMAASSAPVATPATPPAAAPAAAAEPPSQARFDADYLRNPAPPYPSLARRAGEQGTVVLRVSVTPQGTADSVDIKTSSGSVRLDESAQKTVRNWKFIPAKRGETAVQSWVLVPIVFKLES